LGLLEEAGVPRQVFSEEEFLRLAERAKEVRVVKRENYVKVKARLSGALYTLVLEPERAEAFLEQVKRLGKPLTEY